MVQCCTFIARKGTLPRYGLHVLIRHLNCNINGDAGLTRHKINKVVQRRFYRTLNNSTSLKLQPLRNMSVTMTDQSSKPEVTVNPSGHLLMDEELHICVLRLEKFQDVTIHTIMRESEKSLESCCQFRADDNGVVDLYNQPSVSGSYTGVSSMGIFWSLTPTPDMPKGFRLMTKDMDKPLKAEMTVYPGNFTADEIRSQSPAPLTTHTFERWYKGQGVTSTEVTEGRLRGKLYLPQGPGPFPGVIDLFGSAGGLTEYRSALLASRGIASLALAYFLYKDLPNNLYDLDLNYFLEAVSWLLKHPKVYGEGVGVVGVSKGGDIACAMAANCPQVRALININGCTFNANAPLKFNEGVIPAVEMDMGKMMNIEGAWATNNTFEYSESDLLPVWRHNPMVLNILSEDDMCGPNECMHFMKQHYPKDKMDNFMILSYPDAGHLVEPPYSPNCRMSYHKAFDMYFLWGGQPKPHAYAQEHAWRKLLEFFHTHIPKTVTEKSKL